MLGYIDHQGVCVDAGHYVCYVKHNNKWYHCSDEIIFEKPFLSFLRGLSPIL